MKKKLLIALLAATAAVCGAFGLSACGEKPEGGNGGEKHTHDYGTEWIPDKDYHWHECKNDGCDEKIIDKAAHKDDNGDGKCDICKYQISEVVAGEHKLIHVAETKATCTTKGNIAYYICSDCGKWFSDKDGQNEITDKLSVITSYELTPIARIEATCDKDGNKAYYICGDCGKWYSDKDGKNEIKDKTSVILPKGHKLTKVAKNTELCIAGGKEYYDCSDCKKWFWDEKGENEITDKSSITISQKHNFESGLCKICLLPQPPTAGLEYSDKGSYYEVTGIGTATDTDIVIAEKYNGYPVRKISDEAFKNCENLNFISIPNSVTSIGKQAFYGTGLTSIVIPESVISIGDLAFGICEKLSSITVAEGNINYHSNGNCIIETQSKSLIVGCNNSIIPDDGSVTSINSLAFVYCDKLSSLNIPDSITLINDYAFWFCRGLTSITIPYSVESVKTATFYGCWALTIYCERSGKPNMWDDDWNLQEEGSYFPVVWRCTNNEVADNGYLYAIIDGIRYALKDGKATVAEQPNNISGEIILPQNVSYKGNAYNLNSIGNYAFSGCVDLVKIFIPKEITEIGYGAFSYCVNLTDITYGDTIEQWNAVEKGEYWDKNTGEYTIHCKDGDITKS